MHNNECSIYDESCQNQEKFWLDDFAELYKNGNFLKIIPASSMTRNEQLNAITRFSIYMIIIILILNRGETLLFIPIILIILVILVRYINIFNFTEKNRQAANMLNNRTSESFENQVDPLEFVHDKDPPYKSFDYMTVDDESTKNHKIETGYYDADYNLISGPKNETPEFLGRQPPSLYKLNEINDFEKSTCRRPTINNPLMNTPPIAMGTEDPPAACNVDDEDIKESIKVNFNHQLFRDVDELWERENSQRQFYTLPNVSVPNQQKEFAMWLYNTGDFNCKGDNEQCLRWDPLWYNRDLGTPRM